MAMRVSFHIVYSKDTTGNMFLNYTNGKYILQRSVNKMYMRFTFTSLIYIFMLRRIYGAT